MNINNYLDLYDVWVNELVGSLWIFIFLGIVLIWYLSIKNKMTAEATIIFTLLFLSAIVMRTKSELIWVLIVLGVGAFFYFKLQKIIRQG